MENKNAKTGIDLWLLGFYSTAWRWQFWGGFLIFPILAIVPLISTWKRLELFSSPFFSTAIHENQLFFKFVGAWTTISFLALASILFSLLNLKKEKPRWCFKNRFIFASIISFIPVSLFVFPRRIALPLFISVSVIVIGYGLQRMWWSLRPGSEIQSNLAFYRLTTISLLVVSFCIPVIGFSFVAITLIGWLQNLYRKTVNDKQFVAK